MNDQDIKAHYDRCDKNIHKFKQNGASYMCVWCGKSGPLRANREGDSQPLPTPNDYPDIQTAVQAYIEQRKQLGIKRYGTALQPHNGRDALRDAFEEAVDLSMYLAQMLVERDGKL